MSDVLPHMSAVLNAVVLVLITLGWRAIKRGDRVQHPKLMISAGLVGVVFVAVYGLQTLLAGHQRFPGDDWVRTLFVVVLATHTFLAVSVVPLIGGAYYLAWRQRFDAHRKLVRVVWPIWMYVATTGLFIYGMNNWVRPV